MSTWDDKPNDYEHAVKLLARCRDEAIVGDAYRLELAREYDRLKAKLERIRDDTIEECARVAESLNAIRPGLYPSFVAAAIRALKDKP